MDASRWQNYFDVQARGCGRDGSPIYAALVARAGRDHAEGGIVAELLHDWEGNPELQGLAMRLVGAVHHLVLDGRAPSLARHYPSAGGRPSFPDVEEDFLAALREHRAFVAERLQEQLQTNEVRRSAALLGGFLQIAHETRRPLRLLEIGASAGLNQLWDQYRYELGPHGWGPPDATPVLTTDWRGAPPAIDAPVEVVGRAGCDLFPVDLGDTQARRRLESFIWPDQPERRARFLAAAERVANAGVELERSSALPWLEARLAEPAHGVTTILFHSVMWLYLSNEERAGIGALMAQHGEARDSDAPLAWLRMEARDWDVCEVRLRLWPTGEDRLLATCGFHGQHVDWLAEA